MIQAIKRQYQEDFERINKKFLESHNSQSYTTIHSRIIDEHLKSLWVSCNIPEEISLIAVGGYGREEYHHSTNASAQRVWQAEHQIMILHSQNKSKFTPYRCNVG